MREGTDCKRIPFGVLTGRGKRIVAFGVDERATGPFSLLGVAGGVLAVAIPIVADTARMTESISKRRKRSNSEFRRRSLRANANHLLHHLLVCSTR